MNVSRSRNLESISVEMSLGFEEMPILARLQFVRNLIFNRAGDKNDPEIDPVLYTAGEVLDGVIRVLRTAPKAAQLSTLQG